MKIVMIRTSLRKIRFSDKKYFAKWWRDKDLIKLTSGVLKPISDKKINKGFLSILNTKKDYHFMIIANKKTIGHISLVKRRNNWYETQIVIGEKQYWNKRYGSGVIKQLLKKAVSKNISKIYLEVRPNNLRAICAYQKCGFKEIRLIKYPKNKYLPETLRMEFITKK
jgi:RimJ/RimL family protein N-acetyltransferase